jgi:hypothetical protein
VEVSAIITGIDAQISKLQEARNILLSVSASEVSTKVGRGRPKSIAHVAPATKATAASAKVSAPKKRKLSPEGRKRIADAMKLRWAERRKSVAKAATKSASS